MNEEYLSIGSVWQHNSSIPGHPNYQAFYTPYLAEVFDIITSTIGNNDSYQVINFYLIDQCGDRLLDYDEDQDEEYEIVEELRVSEFLKTHTPTRETIDNYDKLNNLSVYIL